MTGSFNKQTMLDRVHASFVELSATLASFDTAQRTIAHSPDGWSVKDVLAHITFWEDYAHQRLAEAARGEKPQLFGDVNEEDINRVNADALAAGRAKSLDVVEADFKRVHAAFVAQIEALPDDPADPFWTLWPANEPNLPWLLIQFNTFDHYAEHLEQLRAWIM